MLRFYGVRSTAVLNEKLGQCWNVRTDPVVCCLCLSEDPSTLFAKATCALEGQFRIEFFLFRALRIRRPCKSPRHVDYPPHELP